MNEREIVLNILMESEKSASGVNIKGGLERFDYLDTRQKAFIKRCVNGTVSYQIQIDYILNQYSKTPVKKMKGLIRALLRMSVYQIMYMDQVPDSAACNEAVKLAIGHHFAPLKGFVNGVLRTVSRQKTQIQWPDAQKEPAKYLSVFYSMPEWICQMWIDTYGYEWAKEAMISLLEARPVSIRMDERMDLSQREALAGQIAAIIGEDNVTASTLLPYVYLLKHTDNLKFLPGFENGLWTVQDGSSMLAVEALDIQSGDKVLDLCAAPGGKTTHAAIKVGDDGYVYSRDLTNEKCDLILENVSRLGLTNIEVMAHDAAVFDDSLEGKCDVVICDLPCSGLGIIARKPDIKQNMSEEKIKELVKIQRSILQVAHRYLKTGGKMLFSTCTLDPYENEEQVMWIRENLKLSSVDISHRFEHILEEETLADGYVTIRPGKYGTDGFFFSVFQKK